MNCIRGLPSAAELHTGRGQGFRIARRLGPDASTTACEQSDRPSAPSLMCARSRRGSGKPLAKRDTVIDSIAKRRADIAAAVWYARQRT